MEAQQEENYMSAQNRNVLFPQSRNVLLATICELPPFPHLRTCSERRGGVKGAPFLRGEANP